MGQRQISFTSRVSKNPNNNYFSVINVKENRYCPICENDWVWSASGKLSDNDLTVDQNFDHCAYFVGF